MCINLTNTVLKFRATVRNSTNAAFELGCRSPKARSFCEKIISIKNENARIKLLDTRISKKQKTFINKKIDKYATHEFNLSILNFKQSQQLVKNQGIVVNETDNR